MHWQTDIKEKQKLNIAIGKTSQALTPFQFFDYFNYFDCHSHHHGDHGYQVKSIKSSVNIFTRQRHISQEVLQHNSQSVSVWPTSLPQRLVTPKSICNQGSVVQQIISDKFWIFGSKLYFWDKLSLKPPQWPHSQNMHPTDQRGDQSEIFANCQKMNLIHHRVWPFPIPGVEPKVTLQQLLRIAPTRCIFPKFDFFTFNETKDSTSSTLL